MGAKLLDGRALAGALKLELKQKLIGISPSLAVVLVGEDPASAVYVSGKKKACEDVGIRSLVFKLPSDSSELRVLELVDELNERSDVDGILVQLPLPKHINQTKVILRIRPDKDVDAFHPYNIGMLAIGNAVFKPCTPSGVVELLKKNNIKIEGKECVVLGRSNIVGKPTSTLLLAENATVTTCHSYTADLPSICRRADILVVAIGKPKFITADMIKENSVIVDVGIHRLDNKKLCGDVDFDSCVDKAGYITPVPGGIGPMTIAMLLKNCVKAFEIRNI